MELHNMPTTSDTGPRAIFQWAVVVWLAGAFVLMLVAAVWLALPALLLAFAAAIFAVVLRGLSALIERRVGLGRPLALALAVAAIIALPLVGWILIGSELKAQLGQVVAALPGAIDAVERRFDIDLTALLKSATLGQGGDAKTEGTGAALPGLFDVARMFLSQLQAAGSAVVSAVAGCVIVVVGGIYLAIDPARYKSGVVMLFPKAQQARIETALDNCGAALDLWLRAQVVSMLAVGVLTGVGAWAIGLPAPLAIGFLTGLLEFIPILGPWLGAIPVLLLAAGVGSQTVVFAGILLLVVQQLEANLITPVLQQRFVDMPPFLLLFGVLAFGLVFGLTGIIVAGPLTLVAFVLVKELYIRDTLGQSVEVPGEQASS